MLIRAKRPSTTIGPGETRRVGCDFSKNKHIRDVHALQTTVYELLTQMNRDRMEVLTVLNMTQALDVGPAVTVLAPGLAALILLHVTRRCWTSTREPCIILRKATQSKIVYAMKKHH